MGQMTSISVPVAEDTGLVGASSVTLNESQQAVNKNEPIFGVGETKIKGYIAICLYTQTSKSEIGGSGGNDNILQEGTACYAGKPYVTSESVTYEEK